MKDIAAGKRVSGPDARGYPRTQAMKDVMGRPQRPGIEDHRRLALDFAAAADQTGRRRQGRRGRGGLWQVRLRRMPWSRGVKPIAGYPVIGGQKANYLALQIKEIRDGVRPTAAPG